MPEVLPHAELVAQSAPSPRLPMKVRCRDCGGSAHGVAGSAAVIAATFNAVGRLPVDLHTPVKARPPVGVV